MAKQCLMCAETRSKSFTPWLKHLWFVLYTSTAHYPLPVGNQATPTSWRGTGQPHIRRHLKQKIITVILLQNIAA